MTKHAVAAERIIAARDQGLTSLDLRGMNLGSVPDDVWKLVQLERLDLSANLLTLIPFEIGRLENLRELEIADNQLTAFPDAICGLHSLVRLGLSSNRFDTLSDRIGDLRELRSLSFVLNRIRTLPKSFASLAQLNYVCAGGNRFTEVPLELRQLKNLRLLSLPFNGIEEVPEWISELGLERLDLASAGNIVGSWAAGGPSSVYYFGAFGHFLEAVGRLKRLPRSLQSNTALRGLYLQGNAALSLPPEILGNTLDELVDTTERVQQARPQQILEYYFRIRLLERRPLNEAKLILVGRGTVGKTSIVNQLVHHRFSPDEMKTDGIQITDWKLRLPDQTDVRLNIWDFGGQEIMHATHQFFLTQRSLYLLVLNGREGSEDADADYWLRLIDSFAADSPVIVVLNKINEYPFDVNRRGLQQKYPFVKDFVKTDCKNGAGIDALLKTIQRETDALEHLRDAFPASWFEIKDCLAGSGRNYLNYDEYSRICAERGEADLGAQAALATYLHSLGIALNYKDDPRLQDTHVLSPHWVTNGIYRILNSELLLQRGGVIGLADLSAILSPADYPPRMHRFLFDLMKKFDLCFSFAGDDGQYLIPELLDKQEPAESAEFNPELCLNFQYHYAVLPEGVLPRFIVRTHVLSEGLARWRTGVVLKFEQNRALVKADVQGRKVFISVDGPVVSRRRLLAVIRADFDRIHRDIKNLQPLEMVPLQKHPDVMVSYRELSVVEQTGGTYFQKVVDNAVLQLDVRVLLDGVDLGPARHNLRAGRAIRLFFSYSHKDEVFRNELETHLKLLHRQRLIDAWHDRRIDPGDEWRDRIDENLEASDVILLLVSADFIASDYCYEKEMRRALERDRQGLVVVVPILVRDVSLKGAGFEHLQLLPKDGLAVTKWPDRDSAWRNVAEGIEGIVSRLQGSA